MYPRNAASPPRISIGAVVQISDGAVQTAGVTVKVIPQGGSEASGGGTVAYSADGVVVYTPTQAETNYAAMVFVASKTGCIPATVTVVTSASETAGYAGVDWAKVGNPTTVVALSSTTISTSQVVASVSGAVGSVTARVTANTDQWSGVAVTGMPLPTAAYTTPPTVAQVVTGVYAALPADHTVSGSYGVRLILALNSYRELQLTGSYHAAAVVHAFQPDVIDATALAASAVTEIQSGLATSANQTTAQADIDDIQSRLPAALVAGRMDASVGVMQADTVTSAALATSAVTEIQTGLATLANQTTIIGYIDTEITSIKSVTDKLNTGLVADGAVWQYTANMLELAPAGGGGAGDASQTTLLQVQTTVNGIASSLSGVPITATGRIADGGTISLYCGDDLRVRSGTQLTLTVTDVGGSIYSRLNTIGAGNLAFGASRRGLPVSAISGSIASLASVGSGASQTVRLVIEIDNAGGSLQPAEDYEWQIESEQTQGSDIDQLVEMAGILILRRRTV